MGGGAKLLQQPAVQRRSVCSVFYWQQWHGLGQNLVHSTLGCLLGKMKGADAALIQYVSTLYTVNSTTLHPNTAHSETNSQKCLSCICQHCTVSDWKDQNALKRGASLCLYPSVVYTLICCCYIQGDFFNWPPPKNHKFKKKNRVYRLAPP